MLKIEPNLRSVSGLLKFTPMALHTILSINSYSWIRFVKFTFSFAMFSESYILVDLLRFRWNCSNKLTQLPFDWYVTLWQLSAPIKLLGICGAHLKLLQILRCWWRMCEINKLRLNIVLPLIELIFECMQSPCTGWRNATTHSDIKFW